MAEERSLPGWPKKSAGERSPQALVVLRLPSSEASSLAGYVDLGEQDCKLVPPRPLADAL